MTSIVEVASHVPARRVPVGQRLTELGLADNAELYERFYGFAYVRDEPDRSLADQLGAAAEKLTTLRGREHDVAYVVHAPTIQLTAPYPDSPVQSVRRRLGLRDALSFSLSQHACASGLLAVDVCGKLLATHERGADALALVLTGEKTFTRVARVIPNSAVMGEATAAILVRAGGEHDRVLAYAAQTLGEYHQGPHLPPALETKFQGDYTAALVEVIRAAVARAGLDPAEVAHVLPHNVNRMSWLRTMRELGLPKDRLMLDNQEELGHCFSADPFINYQTACAGGRIEPGDVYVMTGAGLGATLAATVFRH
jgi:3-oxoacyl-[acyl-carrier-protein] synthase-3